MLLATGFCQPIFKERKSLIGSRIDQNEVIYAPMIEACEGPARRARMVTITSNGEEKSLLAQMAIFIEYLY